MAYAETTPAPAGNSVMDKRLMVSDDGFQAERDIRGARVAIFEGNPDAAKKLVKNAESQLTTVASKAGAFAGASQSSSAAKPDASAGKAADPDLIPIDGQMIVADNMVLTPDKAAKVGEANQHLKNGDTAKAIDTLKQGAIDVAFTRVLMPVNGTTVHVKAAAQLLDDGKYYEANLALKAAQDLMQTDTVAFADDAAKAAKITGVPVSGTPVPPAADAAPAKK